LTFAFSNLVAAFGLQVGAANASQQLTAFDAFNNIIEILTIPDQVSTLPFPYSGFYGINAGAAVIAYFTITGNSGDAWVADNVTYAGPTLPEPGTSLLVATSLAALGLRRLRVR
jgi:hypothetical protein